MMRSVKPLSRFHRRILGRAIAMVAVVMQAALVSGLNRLVRWQELAVQRYTLLELDDRMLKDIGLSRADAWREARRPFWDDPLDSAPAPSENKRAPTTVGMLRIMAP